MLQVFLLREDRDSTLDLQKSFCLIFKKAFAYTISLHCPLSVDQLDQSLVKYRTEKKDSAGMPQTITIEDQFHL